MAVPGLPRPALLSSCAGAVSSEARGDHRILQEVNTMARIRGADPSKQGVLSGIFTRIVYAMTRRKVGRVVMPVQLVAHHRKLLWGYCQMEQSCRQPLVSAGLKDLAQLRVATLVGCPF